MKWIPAVAEPPRLDVLDLSWRGKSYPLPYLHRPGRGGPTLLFVHGLGGSKENFLHAVQSPALAHCALLMFDEPGTGLATFRPEDGLDVSALAELTQLFADRLIGEPYFLAGASMGGLIALLQIRRHGLGRLRGFVNLEGNLASEDCMFSRRAVPHALDVFTERVFPEVIEEMRRSAHAGDRMIAHNLALNVDARAYHTYSFQTVAESDSGSLIPEFLQLDLPRLFLYGEANRHLSYLDRLRRGGIEVVEVPESGHFLFYDNPVVTFGSIGQFVDSVTT